MTNCIDFICTDAFAYLLDVQFFVTSAVFSTYHVFFYRVASRIAKGGGYQDYSAPSPNLEFLLKIDITDSGKIIKIGATRSHILRLFLFAPNSISAPDPDG